jgi:uncharacterized protein (TIGR03083 family)
MTLDERLDALGALWSLWAGHGRAMTDEQWRLPTRLGDWDVRSLYAHAGGWPVGMTRLVDRVRDAEPTHATAAALLRDFNAPDGVANTARDAVAERARGDGERYSTAEMVEAFAGAGPRAIAAARGLGPVVVEYFGRALLRLDEAVSIGVMEATVHLLDLRHALGQPADLPAGGLAHTTAVLVAMAPPVDLIEAATGRVSAVTVFPVLS